MISDIEWAIYSPLGPRGSQLFSLGNGAHGAYNPGASGNLDAFSAYQFTSLNIASGITISRAAYRGPLIILVQGTATIAGSINLNGVGSFGGRNRHSADPWGAVRGYGIGGGAAPSTGSASGGGGGFGTAGSAGTAAGGIAWSDADLTIFQHGSGGGGGSSENGFGRDGGPGGGGLLIVARELIVTGTIVANGGAGGTGGAGPGAGGGGGGGSGGAIWLVAGTLQIGTNLVTALGGAGSAGILGGPAGGAGGVGRIRLDYQRLTGSTNPAAHLHPGAQLLRVKGFPIDILGIRTI